MASESTAARSTSGRELKGRTSSYSSTVDVKFRIARNLEEGKSLFVVGSLPELGGWDINNAVQLRHSGKKDEANVDIYEISVQIEKGSSFQYKYAITSEDEGESWSPGDNFQRSLPQDVSAITYDDNWDQFANPYEKATDGTSLIASDPWLEPFASVLRARFAHYNGLKRHLGGSDPEGLINFARKGFQTYGIHYDEDRKGYVYKEWAPGAAALSLVGDFNFWNPEANPMTRDEFGHWTCFVPDLSKDERGIKHGSRLKVSVQSKSGARQDRLPCWAPYVVQEKNGVTFSAVHWQPENPYNFKHERVAMSDRKGGVRIYEAHVGMSSEEGRVSSYKEFTRDVLPKIKELGFNCVQLMAIMEHAYYASFGYHVTSFFAPSSRCGTPDDLKELVDTAHEMGIQVIMDVVHSHASQNILDGINQFDGTDSHYFHAGSRGRHEGWDSIVFNYGEYETLQFLLSNCLYWVEEFRFDGYRFDGVTSMLYLHHGIGVGFSGDYREYFGEHSMVDGDAIAYLTLANDLLHSIQPPVLTIAEDVSGIPGLCRPCSEGGIGFDYRLGMAIPDYWIKILKEKQDEEWDIHGLVHQLTNRRYQERTIGYAESHDQALVGDKTLAFRLMDKEMYTGMTTLVPANPIIDRGIALHKLIRAVTFALGGEGYLSFMGNEFGHPEWIDFPREGNGYSYHHCRRQWHLRDDPLLRYQHLNNFEKVLHSLDEQYGVLTASDQYISLKNEGDKVLVFEKAGLLWVFNFHPANSFPDYGVGTNKPGKYKLIADSDKPEFGGHNRLDASAEFFSQPYQTHGRAHQLKIYIPNRTLAVYAVVE